MVEANAAGDGIERRIQYAKFRADKKPSPGYSPELISNRVKEEFYDNLDGQPVKDAEYDTLLKVFQRNVAAMPQSPFLGTRQQLAEKTADGKVQFGDYTWQSYAEIDGLAQRFAKGCMVEDLCPQVEGEGKMWRFIGIWMKNRAEWTTTLIASMYYKITTVGFFDAMSKEQVNFILNQTEMKTVVCTPDYAQRIIDMKKEDLAEFVQALVTTSSVSAEMKEEALQNNVRILSIQEVMESGDKGSPPSFEEPSKHDIYMFSYTSGTTGDSKGVKLSHNNIICNGRAANLRFVMTPGEIVISYLPLTHSFEQVLFAFELLDKLRIGFYSGDPLRLVEDCSVLRPQFFPSVPRLYNKIYAKIQVRLGSATGCKRWLVNKGLAAKTANYAANGTVTHGCYDKLIFKKVKALLGGNVRLMATGSAPIDKKVIEYLKIVFCCPILEGYGLTESSAASCVVDVDDPNVGHVGGPTEGVKIRLKDLPEMSYMSTDKPYPRGEVCMKGPSIFSGYYKREDKTAEAFDAEGWFQTGDVAMVYPNGSIKIIDRSKNIFKLSQGEYIAPEKIEMIFGLSGLIAQAFVYGDSLKNACVAVIFPEEEAVIAWAKGMPGLAELSFEQLCQNADLKKAIGEEMMKLAKENNLTSLEKPKSFMLSHDFCTKENGCLTPTEKMKRNIVQKKFESQIGVMYEEVAKIEANRS